MQNSYDEPNLYGEIDHELISHFGDMMPPIINSGDAQRHMGALEDNVHPVTPLITTHEDEHHGEIHRELTPG